MRRSIHLFTLFICTISAIAQTGPAGIGTNDGTSNLQLWLDASKIYGVTSGNTITSPWTDLSGNGYDAEIGDAPIWNSTVGGNSMPALVFDNTAENYLYIPQNDFIMPDNNLSVFVVASYEDASDNWGALISTSDDDAWNDGWGIAQNNGSGDMLFYVESYTGNVASIAIDEAAPRDYGSYQIWGLVYDKDAELVYGYKSEDVDTDDYDGDITYDQDRNNDLLIGTAYANGTSPEYYFNGNISEVIIFDKALSESERIILSNYLAAKYDIELDDNEAYNEDDNGYDYDVAGIGQVASDDYVDNSRGTGIITMYNPSDLEDDEFLIWGHDNGSFLTTADNITASGVEARYERIWSSSVLKSDGTTTADGVGSVSFQIQLESVAPSSASELVLLMDKNGDGEFEKAEVTGATYLGDEIFEFAGAVITHNDLFTIGTTDLRNTPLNNVGPGGYQDGLVTWLKANESAEVTTSTDGSSVTSWDDHWTGLNDASTLTTAPTYRDGTADADDAINFNPTIDFLDGTETGLSIADDSELNDSDIGYFEKKIISIAFRTGNDVTTDQTIFEEGGGSRGLHMFIDNGSVYAGAWNTIDDGTSDTPWGYVSQSASISTETEYILTMVFEGDNSGAGSTAGGTFYAYLNGKLLGTSTGIGRLFDHTDNIGIGKINEGGRTTSAGTTDPYPFYGSISEIIYQNEPISVDSENRQQMESYLALKYGITLDQSTYQVYYNANSDIIFNTGLNTSSGGFEDYDSDIAGIGRDDDSEFEQQKSKSENTGSLVTIDKGGSFGIDESFVVWGNDNGTDDNTETSDVPSAVTRRFDKSWRVAVSGTPGTVDVEIDLTGLTLTGSPGLNDFSLLVAAKSSNGTFGSATIYSANSYASSVVTFEDIEFTDGDFFTLGTEFYACSPGGVGTGDLQIWLDANRGTSTNSDGVDVTSWADISGNENHAIADFLNQSTGASTGAGSAPSFLKNGINYNPYITFTGSSSEFLTIDAPETAADDAYNADRQTIFIVGEMNTTANSWSSFISKVSDDNDWDEGWIVARDGSSNELMYAKDERFGATVPFTEDQSLLVTAYDDNSQYHIAVDQGTEDDTDDRNNTTNGNDIFIGASINNANTAVANFFNGHIAEILVYDTDLDATERSKVASYLAIKYGITLDQSSDQDYLASDGGVIWDASVNSDNNNDLAAIGRDDNSCLNQKQSKSENDGAIVTIGIGSIEEDNRSNGNSFTADDSFLFWGHDGDGTTIITSDVTTNVNSRLDREWKVEENGTVGDVSVSFDLSGLGLSTDAADYILMIDNNGNFSNGSEILGGVYADNTITFNNVDFSDGEYFALGVESNITVAPGGETDDLYVWLKANSGTSTTTNNSSLNTWTDQSASGIDATSDGNAPLFKDNTLSNLNFNPVVNFNGTDDRLALGNLSSIKSGGGNAGSYTMIAVGTREDANTRNYVLATDNAAEDNKSLHFGYRDNTNVTIAQFGNDLNTTVTGYDSPSEPYIILGEFDASVGHIVEETRGGSFSRSTNTNTTVLDNSGTEYIADWPTRTAAFYAGDIAEVIVLDNHLDDLGRRKIYTYLGIKYGISLTHDNDNDGTTDEQVSGPIREGDYISSAGTVIWDYSDNSDFHYDVAGIGVDLESGLSQPKSKSEAGDALVTFDAGSIADDDSWLVWGNDNAQIEDPTATDELPAGIKSRLRREWKVEETGTIGTVSLIFDLSTITGTPTGNNVMNETRLMRSTNSDFTSGVELTAPTSYNQTDQTVTFDIDFTNSEGYFFTLGSLENAALPVTLVTFEAKTSENQVKLDWLTASEENNDYFSVERSTDGQNFDQIGTVLGQGTSIVTNSYIFFDQQPYAGRSYYRLAQYDLNGQVSYSEIRSVYVENSNTTTLEELRVYPNPTRGLVTVEGVSTQAIQLLSASGMDVSGRVMMSNQNNNAVLDLSNLSKGVYLIKTALGTKRIIKQ